jgi:hypothetical protein
MQKSRFRIPVIVAVALAVVGATPTGRADSHGSDNPEITPQRTEATIQVRNHNSLDVEVVAVTEAGRRFRLGAVHGGAGRTFALPRDVSEGGNPFRLKVYSIGRKIGPSVVNHYLEAVKTPLLSPNADGEIVLQVQSPLSNSFIDRGPSGQS